MNLEKILSIPKSFWVSLHFFSLKDAIKLPVVVRYNTKIQALSGTIKVGRGGGKKTAMLSVGFSDVGIYDKKYSRTILEIKGTVVLKGSKVTLGHGSALSVQQGAIVTFGDNFCNTAEGKIVCQKSITFGNNVLTSWETLIMDTDWHAIQDVKTGEVSPIAKDIVIGDNVWIGTRSVILKGSTIPSGCIIGANTLCTKKFTQEQCVIAGNPAKVCKSDVTLYAGPLE